MAEEVQVARDKLSWFGESEIVTEVAAGRFEGNLKNKEVTL